MPHRCGDSVEDLVTAGGMILSGLAIQCSQCRASFIIEGNQYKGPSVIIAFCPYCGHRDTVDQPDFIHDSRSVDPDS